MKNIIYPLLLSLLFQTTAKAQTEWVSGSVTLGSQANQIALYIRTTNAFDANTCDNMVFTIRIPVSSGPSVEITEILHDAAFSHLSFHIQKLNVTDGAYYYYLVSGTGSMRTASGQLITPGTAYKVLELRCSGGSSGIIELVNLENDLPGNMFIRPQFYVQNHMGDITRYGDIFFGDGTSSVMNNAPGTGDDWVTTSNLVVLPARFLSFRAEARGFNGFLAWRVTQENAQTDEYVVERSISGFPFETVGILKAVRRPGTNTYTLTDEQVGRLAGGSPVLYRIRQKDLDGRQTFSTTERIRFESLSEELSVFPNPARQYISLAFTESQPGFRTLQIVSQDGRTLKSRTIQVIQGLNLQKIEVQDLPAGTYQVILTENNKRKISTFIKR